MINDFTIMIIMKWKILDCPPFVFKLFQVVMVQTRIELLSGPAQGGGGKPGNCPGPNILGGP